MSPSDGEVPVSSLLATRRPGSAMREAQVSVAMSCWWMPVPEPPPAAQMGPERSEQKMSSR